MCNTKTTEVIKQILGAHNLISLKKTVVLSTAQGATRREESFEVQGVHSVILQILPKKHRCMMTENNINNNNFIGGSMAMCLHSQKVIKTKYSTKYKI